MQRAIYFSQRLAIASVNADVELRDVAERGELCGMLRITDEESTDPLAVQQRQELVDVRVEDRLTD